MKVLYVGNYRNRSGYSYASLNNILALNSVGVDVVCRHVSMIEKYNENIPEIIDELEKKDLEGIDAIIQHNLPTEFFIRQDIPNIGVFHFECDGAIPNEWKFNASKMDVCIRNSKVPGYEFCPMAIDVSRYDKQHPKETFGLPADCIKFYSIGEFNRRKNWPALILSYLSAFSSSDNVALVIKTDKAKELEDLVNQVRSICGIYQRPERYPTIIVIGGELSEDDIDTIHSSCDVFVSSSYGEDPCIPFIDALGFQKPCIIPETSGFINYQFEDGVNSLVDFIGSQGAQCYNEDNPGLYNSKLTWKVVSTEELTDELKYFYHTLQSSSPDRDERLKNTSKFIQGLHSHESVGRRLKEIVETAIENRLSGTLVSV